MRFIALSSSSEAELRARYVGSTNVVERQRCQCLLLSSRGHSIGQLTDIFQVNRLTIYQWFNRWQTDGLLSLRHRPGQGRKAKLAAVSPQVLNDLVAAHPQNLKAVLAELETHHAVQCSKGALRRHLKNTGVALQAGTQLTKKQA